MIQFLKNNYKTLLIFMGYTAIFACLGVYLNNTIYFTENQLITWQWHSQYIIINAILLVLWASFTNISKYKNIAKFSNLIVLILSATAFAKLIIMYTEAVFLLDRAHWPLSNLYEVSVFLYAITTLLSYYFVKENSKLSIFLAVMLLADVYLIAWLASLDQNIYKELMPALRSYWLPTHVAANFIGYGAFAIAGMAGLMGIVKHYTKVDMLPSVKVTEDISFRAIAVGFPMFTIATILGSVWAYEAWGAYWSWDPKETWALIVWLVYGTYLHLRVRNVISPIGLCWLSFAGFFITLFCFLGVNMYLSGLHSYGQLT